MAIKTGVDHSNNKERCSAGNLDDLLWKYCKSRYADLSCSDVHWNFWRMCNALRLGSEVCNWYRLAGAHHGLLRLAISPIWRRRSTNVQKSLQSLFCILHPACVLLLVCSLLFTLSLHLPLFRSLESAVRSLRFTLTEWIFETNASIRVALQVLVTPFI